LRAAQVARPGPAERELDPAGLRPQRVEEGGLPVDEVVAVDDLEGARERLTHSRRRGGGIRGEDRRDRHDEQQERSESAAEPATHPTSTMWTPARRPRPRVSVPPRAGGMPRWYRSDTARWSGRCAAAPGGMRPRTGTRGRSGRRPQTVATA